MRTIQIVADVTSEVLSPEEIAEKLTKMLNDNIIIAMGLKKAKVKVIEIRAEEV